MKSTAALTISLCLVAALVSAALRPTAVLAQASATPRGDFVLDPEDPADIKTKGGGAVLIADPIPEDGTIAQATFVGVQANGTTVTQLLSPTRYNKTDTTESQYFFNDGGTLRARIIMPCIFSDPNRPCSTDHGPVTDGYLQVRFTSSQTVYESELIGIDYEQPALLFFVHDGPTQIRAVFNEPVRLINPDTNEEAPDLPTDWRVDGGNAQVIRVDPGTNDCNQFGFPSGTSGCTRILIIAPPQPGDRKPTVDYLETEVEIVADLRDVYEDYAGNSMLDLAGLDSSIDEIRPFIPTIVSVRDTVTTRTIEVTATACTDAPQFSVVGNSDAPTLSLENFAAENEYIVEIDGDLVVGPNRLTQAQPFSVVLPTGTFTHGEPASIKVVALDPANGDGSQNRSDSPNIAEPSPTEGSDGDNNPLCYTADLVAPRATGASRSTANLAQVIVSFDETLTQALDGDLPLVGDADPDVGVWRAGGQTASDVEVVEGSDGRQLIITFPAAVGPTVAAIEWAPCADPDGTDPCAYTDAVGNAVRPFAAAIEVPLPLNLVSFTNPVPGPVFIGLANREDFPITGLLSTKDDPADVVSVNVTPIPPDGVGAPPVDDAAGGTQEWATSITFPDGGDGTWAFDAVAEGAFNNSSNPARSPDVIFDGTLPVVAITDPAEPEPGTILNPEPSPQRVPNDGVMNVTMTVDEVNYESVTLSLEVPGSDTVTVTTGQDDQPEGNGSGNAFTLRLPTPEGYEGEATLRATSTDLAGNVSSEVVRDFIFDLGLVDITRAELLLPQTEGDPQSVIRVTYPVSLTGTSSVFDWSADDGINEGSNSRNPVRVQVDGANVRLTFAGPFPSVIAGRDRNATPRVTYDPAPLNSLGASNGALLQDPDSAEAEDLDAPGAPEVTGPRGIISLEPGERVRYTGTTHPSARPNEFRVLRIPAGTNPDTGQGIQVVAWTEAGEDGAFAFETNPDRNATTTYRVEVRDPNGNAGTSGRVLTITDDSIGPDLTSLSAGFVDVDTILISYAFRPVDEAKIVELSYLLPDSTEPVRITDDAVAEDGKGTFLWNLPQSIDPATTTLRIHARGRDALDNLGVPSVTGLGDLPELDSAVVSDATSIIVSTTEPVTTAVSEGRAGFSLQGGPGVVGATPTADDRIFLTLDGELSAIDGIRVTYNGQGEWAAADGRPLVAGDVPLALGETLFPVTNLVATQTRAGDGIIAFSDNRNPTSIVSGYEVARDDEVVGFLTQPLRQFTDVELPESGTVTYTVVTVGTDGARSGPVSVELAIGDGTTPVPAGAGEVATSGGAILFPTDSQIVTDCPFPGTANITPDDGGVVVDCEGRVFATVPTAAVDVPVFAKWVRRSAPPSTGFAPLGSLYQLVAVRGDTFSPMPEFARYADITFLDLRDEITGATAELVTAVRASDDGITELPGRVQPETLETSLLTLGTFRAVEAEGRTLRIYGPDPAIAADRFATAAGLSQTGFRRAGSAVIARADDYPDALAAAPLAAQVGAPLLLSRTGSLPDTTLLELYRLGVQTVYLVGGEAAMSAVVEQRLNSLGFDVERFGGSDRFVTAALVAEEVGSRDGGSFLATGTNFADALAASAAAAHLGRPILLSTRDGLHPVSRLTLEQQNISEVHIIGGPSAIAESVGDQVAALGLALRRSGGQTRYETATVLAQDLDAAGLLDVRNVLLASGDGDGRTSPDAVAAGPLGGQRGSAILLTRPTALPPALDAFLQASPDTRAVTMAGGPVAIADEVRALVDATG